MVGTLVAEREEVGAVHCPGCRHDNRREARFCEACGMPLAAPSTGGTAVAPATESLPTAVGGRYTPSRLLGEGARKKVYLALDERLGREVAVAVVKTEGLDDDGRARVSREIRSMAQLGDHALIVTVHDVGEESGTPFIVSQYMKGGSLAERLGEAPDHRLPIREVLTIGEQVARALAHAHSYGIVHRDVKPANVWIDGDGNALLGDFGLAVPLDASRITTEGLVVGTVAYLAPEQALGGAADPRADLYSLGALLYECLCGRPPFLGDDAVGVISQHLNVTPVAPSWHEPQVPSALDGLVLRLLAKDPSKRPSSAADVAADIARLWELYDSQETVVSAAASPEREDLLKAEWGRFVGRTEEVALLRSLFDDCLSGRTRAAMVVGEPGVGKTRLVEELSTYAAMRGAEVCWGHSYEGEGGLPYLPFTEALSAHVRASADGSLLAGTAVGLAEVATLVPELRERLPALPVFPPLEGGAERLRLFEGIASFLRSGARSKPVVLVLDDLQWADKPSLLLLQHLVHTVRDARLLVVGTYRDVELDRAHPLAEVVANLRRQRLYERVLLRGLCRDDVKSLVEAVAAQEVSEDFVDLLSTETEGNPFFVQEVLRHLVDSGALRRESGRWVAGMEDFAAQLPEGIREVIGRRLDALSDGCNDVLTVASAMPGGFTMEVVGEVAGIGDETMLDLLDEALAAQLVRERRDRRGTYEFNHSLIRQTLYRELSTPRRARMHRRILTALEARFVDSLDAHMPELAYHAHEAVAGGDTAKTIEYAMRAGEQAMTHAAYEEAMRYYEMALNAMEASAEVGSGERADVLLMLGRAASRAGDAEQRRTACLAAAEFARHIEDPERLAHAAITLLGTVGPAITSTDKDIAPLLEEAAASLRAARQPPARQALLAEVLARQSGHLGDTSPQRSETLGQEAVAVARQAGDPRSLALALLYSTYAHPLERDEYRARLREAAKQAEAVDDPEVALIAQSALMGHALLWADRDEFERHLAEYTSLAETVRSPTHLMSNAIDRAGAAALDGRYAEARDQFREALRRSRWLGDPSHLVFVASGMFPVNRELGLFGHVVDSVRRNIETSSGLPVFRATLVRVLCDAGERDEAVALLEELVESESEALRSGYLRRFSLAVLAESAELLGHRGAAEKLYSWLQHELSLGDCIILGANAYCGALRRYVGLLALTLGRPDEAVEHHEAALEVHERMRARGWAARSRYDLARALLARAAEGDVARAAGLIGEAFSAAHNLGMPKLLEEALAVKLELQGVSPDTSSTMSIDLVSASVAIDRPDLRVQAGPDGHVTICFSDIVGYTRMTDRLGDARTHDVLRVHNEILRRELRSQGGVEVKSEGDGFMLVFSNPSNALRFAHAFQRELGAHEWPDEVGDISVRIGVHTGEVIRDADDFFGRTVIIGARIAAQAIAGEVLVTDTVRKAAEETEFAFGEPRELELKGLSGTHHAHPMVV